MSIYAYANITEELATTPELLAQAIEEVAADEGMSEAQAGAVLIASFLAVRGGSQEVEQVVEDYIENIII